MRLPSCPSASYSPSSAGPAPACCRIHWASPLPALATVASRAHTSYSPVTQLTDASVSRTIKYPLNGTTVNKNELQLDPEHAGFVQSGSGTLLIPSFDDSIDTRQLPRLAWVIVVTPNHQDEYSAVLMATSCYCLRNNIPLFIEHHTMLDDRHFFTARHRSAAKYLRYYQWVLVTDADTMVADSSVDARVFLDDSVDVIMNDRSAPHPCCQTARCLTSVC